jgi:phosphate uptake regulator
MSEARKIQKVGYSTLTVSIPSRYTKELGLREGDNVIIREEFDGTLRLIPQTRSTRTSKVLIKIDLIGNEELLSKLIVSCYMLGYDTIELNTKNGKSLMLDKASKTIRRLRGVEIVESSQNKLLVQSFMDPTKFPVDSLIKRLQLLVSRSLENAIQALQRGSPGLINEVRRIKDELDELYWLIVRQLLVALNNREISAKIGLESPLHTSGDRVSAKTINEIGGIMVDLTEEIVKLREIGARIEGKTLEKIGMLAKKAQESFNTTIEGLLASDIYVIEKAIALINETLDHEKEIMHEFESIESAYPRTIVSDLGQVARYCSIIIEIGLNRLLRKTSKICVIQS